MGALNKVNNYIFKWGPSETLHPRGSPMPLAWVILCTYFTLFTYYQGYAGKPRDVNVSTLYILKSLLANMSLLMNLLNKAWAMASGTAIWTSSNSHHPPGR